MNARTRKAARPSRRILVSAFALFAYCLLGCAACFPVFNPGPPPTRLQLHPDLPGPSGARVIDKQLVVALPTAGPELESDAIVLVFHGREVRQLSGARWTGPLPSLLQGTFVAALESSGNFVGVSDEVTGLVAHARLLSEIRMFGLDYEAEGSLPVARFSVHFRLLDLYSGRIMATRAMESRVPATGRDPVALAGACEKALEAVLAELVEWTAAEMRRGGKP